MLFEILSANMVHAFNPYAIIINLQSVVTLWSRKVVNFRMHGSIFDIFGSQAFCLGRPFSVLLKQSRAALKFLVL